MKKLYSDIACVKLENIIYITKSEKETTYE